MQQGSLFYDFGAPIKATLRLSEIQEILRRTKIIQPPPSRSTLIARCEDGTLEANLTSFGWVVNEDSFKRWVVRLTSMAA
jgi:hypothetical protein